MIVKSTLSFPGQFHWWYIRLPLQYSAGTSFYQIPLSLSSPRHFFYVRRYAYELEPTFPAAINGAKKKKRAGKNAKPAKTKNPQKGLDRQDVLPNDSREALSGGQLDVQCDSAVGAMGLLLLINSMTVLRYQQIPNIFKIHFINLFINIIHVAAILLNTLHFNSPRTMDTKTNIYL